MGIFDIQPACLCISEHAFDPPPLAIRAIAVGSIGRQIVEEAAKKRVIPARALDLDGDGSFRRVALDDIEGATALLMP